ncbi:family 2 glycosyl transferase [Oleiphilus messinensis]|uniref:Family 2 glycosyl transferase n=1 Tax=Oleiphilus messinensis TaxID=141451 RepID=A0A1Y0I946_9GAMM|nr:glycosyltransferase family 2 protein [Oleiphilus messinensis]ARU56005.1 family 2 glycosyl transferase [Oleiphilus messinensis]
MSLSVVIPAKNEAPALVGVLAGIKDAYPEAEIIVVNDGSTDNTSKICADAEVVEVVHPYSKGNGAAIKSGARRATGDTIVFMDGDGQHKPEDIRRLLAKMDEGYDMVVGARGSKSQASLGRLAANSLYNTLASWMVGHQVQDLTSGFRAVRAAYFKQFLHMLPNGFSYPTTITMSFFRAGYSVAYIPIEAPKRIGKSHINLARDGVRFLLIIFKIGTLYSPLKLFAPISLLFFMVGLSYYFYTFFSFGRFTNMSALLFSTSVIIFLMGLVSEQITALAFASRGGPRATDVLDSGHQLDSSEKTKVNSCNLKNDNL